MIYAILYKVLMVLYNTLWNKPSPQQKIESMGAISMETSKKNIIVGFEDIKVKLLPFIFPQVKPMPRANSWPCILRRPPPLFSRRGGGRF